jgi:hypothetical protein
MRLATGRLVSCVIVGTLCWPVGAIGQQPPPAAQAGVVPPDRKLPPHIRKLTGFGERAEFSLDSKRVLFLSKTSRRRADLPVVQSGVSDDGRYMAFQMGRSGVAAGIGYGLFLYDFTKAPR